MGRPLKFVLNALHIVDPLALKIGFGDFFQFRTERSKLFRPDIVGRTFECMR